MKTFIVYDLDTGLPIAVGEAIKAEWARVETAEETNIRAENLIAEEISLGKEFELPMKMKCAVVSTLISLAFVSQASAVLRPLFPIKPAAPFNGELIVIGDDLVLRSAKKPCCITGARHSSQCLDTGYGLCHEGCLLRRLRSRKICHGRDDAAMSIERNRFGVASFILDIAWQRAYERSCRQVAPHVPRGARRD